MTIASGSTDAVGQALEARAGQAPQAGKTLADYVQEQFPRIARSMPAGVIEPDRFMNTVLTVLRKNPDLMECERYSFMGSMATVASLGLEIDPALGQAYLIPYNKQCTLQIGYKGWIELAWRNGITIESNDVRKNDVFHFERGTNPHLTHTWEMGEERGEVIGYYATATFPDGRVRFYVMDLDDIAKRRTRSKVRSDRGPWATDPVAMAKKTVIRAMVPQIPMSTELSRALEVDEGIVKLSGTETTVSFPETPDLEVGGGVTKSDWRLQAEQELDDLVAGDRDSEAWLMREHGPIPTLSDDRLQLAIEGFHAWAAAEDPSAAPQGTPVADPTDPGPPEPQGAAQAPQVTDSMPPLTDEERDQVIRSTTAMVTAMPIAKVRETLSFFRDPEHDPEVPTTGGAQKTLLIEVMVRERLARNQAALDMF